MPRARTRTCTTQAPRRSWLPKGIRSRLLIIGWLMGVLLANARAHADDDDYDYYDQEDDYYNTAASCSHCHGETCKGVTYTCTTHAYNWDTVDDMPSDDRSTIPVRIFGDHSGMWEATATSIYIANFETLHNETFIINPAPALQSLYIYNIIKNVPSKWERTFSPLTTLTRLTLFKNDIYMLGKMLDTLTALNFLSLDLNKITLIVAGSFDKLTALQTLYLSRNNIASILAGTFDKLTALQMLYLRQNAITFVTVGTFDKLTALRTLDLKQNAITFVTVGTFDKLTALRTLDLAKNLIRAIARGSFDMLTALKKFDIQDNILACPSYYSCLFRFPFSRCHWRRGIDTYLTGPFNYSCDNIVYTQCVENEGQCTVGNNTPWPTPTTSPTISPTVSPTNKPTISPTSPTISPSTSPSSGSPSTTPTIRPTTIASFNFGDGEFREEGASELESERGVGQDGGTQHDNGNDDGQSSSVSDSRNIGKAGAKRDVKESKTILAQREKSGNQARQTAMATINIDKRSRGAVILVVVLVTVVAALALAVILKRSRQSPVFRDGIVERNDDVASERTPLVV